MIHDWNSVVEKHAQTMLQQLYLIVNIPVTQIAEEIGEVNIPVAQIVEEIVNIPVSQIVEEIVKIPFPQIVEDRRGEQILDCVEEYPEPLF